MFTFLKYKHVRSNVSVLPINRNTCSTHEISVINSTQSFLHLCCCTQSKSCHQVSVSMYRLVFYFLLWDGHKVKFCCILAIYRRKQEYGDVDGRRKTQSVDWAGELGCPVQCSDLSTENPAGHHTETDQEGTRHARGAKRQKCECPFSCNL